MMDWTHKSVSITDIRKTSNLYVIAVKGIDSPLLINEKIFNERLKSYFLKDPSKITRDEILGVKWNMYVTKGHYVKIHKENDISHFNMDPDRLYVSYLEINGPLAGFQSVYKPIKE